MNKLEKKCIHETKIKVLFLQRVYFTKKLKSIKHKTVEIYYAKKYGKYFSSPRLIQINKYFTQHNAVSRGRQNNDMQLDYYINSDRRSLFFFGDKSSRQRYPRRTPLRRDRAPEIAVEQSGNWWTVRAGRRTSRARTGVARSVLDHSRAVPSSRQQPIPSSRRRRHKRTAHSSTYLSKSSFGWAQGQSRANTHQGTCTRSAWRPQGPPPKQ